MSGRKLNPLELRIHQAALSDPQKTLTSKELEVLVPDVNSRKDALNFLLGTGMLKVRKDAKGAASFRAVTKNEMDVKKDMSGEESMVLSHIQACGNEGIWTKHLKAKTELHQTVIDRCLKSLVQKQLIKAVKNVKHLTRKIYMLYHLEPSVEMTGGPWYTDSELDTEFIKLLSSACLHYVKDRIKSFPKKSQSKDDSSNSQRLFPISASPSYPTAQQIQAFLSKSKITETTLNVEHVEMLLNVLVLDGEIERVPAFGAAMWDASVDDDEDEESGAEPRKKKRKHDSKHKKHKHAKRQHSDSESDEESSKKSKKRKRDDRSDTGDDSDHKSKKRRKRATSDDEEPKKSKKKNKKARHDSSSSSPSDSSSESEDEPRSRRSKSKKSARKRSASPAYDLKLSGTDDTFGNTHVYRAIRQERVALGWSEAPCGRCPVFDFCKEKGPVNPKECTYYEEWLKNGLMAIE